MSFKRILVPTDFSTHAEVALETAIEFAKAFNSEVHLVHGYYLDVPPSYIAGDGIGFINPQDILEPIREAAEDSLEKLIRDTASRGIKVEGRVLMGPPAQVTLAEVERLNASLIVMGTRGLTGLKHVLLGSTAERVVRMAACPVVTVKAMD